MEPLTLFTGAVGLIGIIHIGDNIAKVLAKGKGAAATKTVTPSNWYCFFKLSDLLGPDWKPVEQRERERKNLTDTKRDEKRRNQAKRPRLYV
ncbi:MAG: hypothetical protein KKC76_10595 [Proteobacteria bacterium]|nr:hypothetical protein [Pseudomonadota bacterium]MBU4296254.1 hypothetical protein [Pseudomonadota bacterium]MCG2746388.1 hypothetical protein [Desulfobulbaceae bacterium]